MTHDLPQSLLTLNFLVRAAVLTTPLLGIWLAVHRTNLPVREQTRTAVIFSAILIGWFGVAWWLGQAEFFVAGPGEIPTIQYALFIPIIAGLTLILRTARGRAIVTATPQSWLVAIQVYRALGAMFLLFWWQGQMPGEFAIPAGIGDIITGVVAPYVAWLNARDSQAAAGVTRTWNLFGIADLAIAVTTGFLTSPSALQLLAFDRPNTLITEYPTVMVPAFLVPLSIILHGLSLWKLRHV